MNTSTSSGVFFIISSFGFVILWILAVIFFVYLIHAMRIFSRILKQIEKNIDSIGDTTKDMIMDIRESTVFKFLFKKKRRGQKNN
jgi:hypothetical protein